MFFNFICDVNTDYINENTMLINGVKFSKLNDFYYSLGRLYGIAICSEPDCSKPYLCELVSFYKEAFKNKFNVKIIKEQKYLFGYPQFYECHNNHYNIILISNDANLIKDKLNIYEIFY